MVTSIIYSQGAMPFMTVNPSPVLQGAASIGSTIPVKDALGYIHNPALLGQFCRDMNVGLLIMPDNVDYPFYPDSRNIYSRSFAATLGYNLNKHDIPLSIGFGFQRSKITFDKFKSNNLREIEDTYDLYSSFSLGIGIELPVLVNLGVTLNSFESYLGNMFEEKKPISVTGTAWNLGAFFTVPISKLLFDDCKFFFDDLSYFKPITNFSFGYSQLNIGEEIYYIDPAQSDPLSRSAKLGYNFEVGFDLQIKNVIMNFFSYSFSAEADDYLVKYDNNHNIDYQSFLGDIKVGKHLIQLKPDNDVIVRKAHIFKLMETITITAGRFEGYYYTKKKSNGLGFSSEGLVKLLNLAVDNNVVNYIATHCELEYYTSYTGLYTEYEPNYKGLYFYFKNITF